MTEPAIGAAHASARCFDVTPDIFRAAFSRAPFTITHHLAQHPLLALERLVELAGMLPPASVEYNDGNLPVALADEQPSPRSRLTIEETLAGLERHNSWMVLQNVEQAPAYRELLDDCLREIARYSEPIAPGMQQGEGFVFISSPGATTPYHMDPEHSFLLQIHGGKSVTVFDGSAPAVLRPVDLEQFYSGMRHRNMHLPEGAMPFAREFVLGPGDALHIPVTCPHYVRVGSAAYSVSFSVTFRTPELYRRRDVHYFNGFLRRRGLRPRPYGQSGPRDAVKQTLGWLLRRVGQRRASA